MYFSVAGNFYVQRSRLNQLLLSFSKSGVRIWNKIPLTLHEQRKNPFKRRLHKLLIKVLETKKHYCGRPCENCVKLMWNACEIFYAVKNAVKWMCEKLHYVKNMWNWFHKLPWVSHTCEILLACEKNVNKSWHEEKYQWCEIWNEIYSFIYMSNWSR